MKRAIGFIIRVFKKIGTGKMPDDTSLINEPKIEKADNVVIESTARFSTSEGGVIRLMGNNYIGRNVELGTESSITIGYGTTIQNNSTILGDVEIGKFCKLSLNILASSGRHYYDVVPEYYISDQDELVLSDEKLQKEHSRKIIIEDDCWIGINSVISAGIKIGRGSVIGANSVVTKNVEPFSVMGGVPAKEIRKRLIFSPKSYIVYTENADLPNFYKGFFVDVKNLKLDRIRGGIAAGARFECYMEFEGKKKLIIDIKKIVSEELSISYNNQVKKIKESDFVTLAFEVGHARYHEFTFIGFCESLNQPKLGLVKSITIN
jgi:acetyltransferase-like isoleucine patch superfamily enzyme